MDVFSIWTVVGGGTVRDPYRTSWMPPTVQGKARLLLGGIACFDTVTGNLNTGSPLGRAALGMVSNYRELQRFNDHVLVRVEATAALATAFETWLWPHVLWDYSLPALRNRVQTVRNTIFTRLQTAFPAQDWTHPLQAAANVIDSVQGQTFNGFAPTSYYRQVLDSAQATPEDPVGFITNAQMNVALTQAFDVPDQLSNVVRLCDLAFGLIASHRAVASV